jgi:xanthine dehydrogenase YagS FAD-binding subunit
LGNVLEPDEMITEIRVPRPAQYNRQVFIKHRVRDTIDFATVSLSLMVSMNGKTVADARLVLGAVAPGPYRATGAEAVLVGKPINDQTLENTASAAVEGAVPLSKNGYKIDIIKSLVKKSL